MVSYINSTYMEQFLSPSAVGAFFTVGAAFAAVAFVFFTPLLIRFGNNRLAITIALLDIGALVALGITDNGLIAIPAFLLFLVLNPLLFLNIDIYAESIIGEVEDDTGKKRGLVLTFMSIAAMLAPLSMGAIFAMTGNLMYVYLAAAFCFSFFVIFIATAYRGFIDPIYERVSYIETMRKVWRTPAIRNVCFSHLLLQMFFAWMVIYVPLYLVTELNHSWESVGSIIAVAMLAFVLLGYPTGILADRYWGEKELMATGFCFLAVSAAWIGMLPVEATVGLWMVVLFTSRVGAALVETTTESYFFKHTRGNDADLINFFRILRPVANVVGAGIGSICLLFFPFSFIFFILAVLMVPGLFVTMQLQDTR